MVGVNGGVRTNRYRAYISRQRVIRRAFLRPCLDIIGHQVHPYECGVLARACIERPYIDSRLDLFQIRYAGVPLGSALCRHEIDNTYSRQYTYDPDDCHDLNKRETSLIIRLHSRYHCFVFMYALIISCRAKGLFSAPAGAISIFFTTSYPAVTYPNIVWRILSHEVSAVVIKN